MVGWGWARAERREERVDQKPRREAGDREAAEAVEDALLDVAVEVHPDRDAAERDRLGEDAGEQELQVVVLRAAGDRAAEDVGEQRDEDDRLQRHVDQ